MSSSPRKKVAKKKAARKPAPKAATKAAPKPASKFTKKGTRRRKPGHKVSPKSSAHKRTAAQKKAAEVKRLQRNENARTRREALRKLRMDAEANAEQTDKAARQARSAKAPTVMQGGYPSFDPTIEQRQNVEVMIGLGLKPDEICLLITNPTTGRAIDKRTFHKHFDQELARGGPKTAAAVGHSIVKRAIDLSHPQGAQCAMFYAKTRMGWRETVHVQAEIKSGVFVAPASVSPEDWINEQMAVASAAVKPGEDV